MLVIFIIQVLLVGYFVFPIILLDCRQTARIRGAQPINLANRQQPLDETAK